MKSKTLFGFLCVSLFFILIVVWTKAVNADKQSTDDTVITLKVSSDKQSYIQGEAVNLTFEAINKTDKSVDIYDVSSGFLNVKIAFNGERFNQYKNTSWGTSETGGKRIKPGESYKSQAKVLWNSNPVGTFSNVESIVNSEKGAILSDYAFPEAGIYLIKAVLSVPSNTLPTTLTKIESEPIQITVNKPVGDDLEVWNKIKDNKEIANFMHRGSFLGWKSFLIEDDKELSEILKEIEEIVQSYPNSLLVGQLKPNLEKFRANEEKKKANMRKIKKPN